MIVSGDGGQFGNGVDSFLSIDMVGSMLADMIGGVVFGTCGGGWQLAQFMMGGGKKVLNWVQVLLAWYRFFHSLQLPLTNSVWKIN